MNWNNFLPYAPAIIKVLTGTVYSHNKEWDLLLSNKIFIKEYFEQIGIELLVFEEEGYAFLNQDRWEDLEEETQIMLKNYKKIENIPVLIQRKQLSDEQTLLCVLLREKFDEVDDKLISKKTIFDMLRDFFKEKLNKEKEEKHFQQLINSIIDLGFITLMNIPGSEEFYKIEKIIRAKIDIDKITDIRNKLIQHYESLG